MITQSLGKATAAYPAMKTSFVQRQTGAFSPANPADQVNISAAAKALLADAQIATQEQGAQRRLDTIKTKPALERSPEETAYVEKNDRRFGELKDKIKADGMQSLSADELDYMQKASGFVNTMAELSPKEKALYDELVAHGKWEAAQGLNLVAMSRIGHKGQEITLPNGRTFDPTSTEVTPDNIRNLFRHMFVDSSGSTDRQFEALASYLEQRPTQDKPAGVA